MTLYFFFYLIILLALAFIVWPAWQNRALPRHTRLLGCAAICLFFLGGAFGFYALLGAPHIVPLLAQREIKMTALKKNILDNSAAVKADPKNLRAWVELGESFMETGQYGAASNAFRRAVVLSGGQPQIIVAYAQALIAAADGKVTDDAKKSLEMALLQQPDNPWAHYYLAVHELQDGHMDKAMADMRALYHSLPANSPVKAMIDREIGRK